MKADMGGFWLWQDCGKPYYVTNYLAFFHAIKERYPHMQLIANCNMGTDAPTEMWDWCVAAPGSPSFLTMRCCCDIIISSF